MKILKEKMKKPETPVVELRNVWKVYKLGKHDIYALRGLNLKILKGEFVAIQGPSGSGKSTMMNLIGCLDVPTKGSIYLDGQDIAKFSESDLATIRGGKIGFVFQTFNLIPNLTALQNVELPLIFYGTPERERKKRAEKLLKVMGLRDRMHHKPGELSGGEQQRVAIARALSIEPEIILADEPTGNLDSKTGVQIMRLLCDLNTKYGKTVVLVTHDDATARFADRIEFLKDGKIIKSFRKRR